VIYIYDKNKQRVIHYCNEENFDILDIFNNEFDREFITNKDYGRVGGNTDIVYKDKGKESTKESITMLQEDDENQSLFEEEDGSDQIKATSCDNKRKRKQYKIKWNQQMKTSKIGTIRDQM